MTLVNRAGFLASCVIAILGFLSAAASAAQPSFDCSKASTLDENAICSNETLAAIDRIADGGYVFLKSMVGARDANEIDRPIIRKRQACGSNYSCILISQIEAIRIFMDHGAPLTAPKNLALSKAAALATQPSFECSKASRPDEYAICSNETLATMDRIANDGYVYMKSTMGLKAANKIDRHIIRRRQACGGNYSCILISQIKAIDTFMGHGAPLIAPNNLLQSPANAGPQVGTVGHEDLQMIKEGGVYVVPVRFNDMITLNAIVDSGASDVSVPADVVSTLVRTNTITDDDFLGKETYVLADGSKVPSARFRIRSLKVGSVTLENVVASIAPQEGPILLGQSFLGRFKSWSVDNERHVLKLD